MLTIPHHSFTPYLPPQCSWIKGQLELGGGGFLHWQLLIATKKKTSLRQIVGLFGPFHAELSRSERASEYVWKEDTRVDGTCFELGAKPIRVNAKIDWESIWTSAVSGDLSTIPAGVRIRSYFAIRSIASDMSKPIGIERQCFVFWGKTGTGKSRRAWDEATMEAYGKDPRTKFWDGYTHQENIVIDEFRGGIDVAHLLRWLDRYPVRVEIKGSSRPLFAKKIWITSNLHPRDWYKEIDEETRDALLRRLNITQFH